MKRYMYFTIVKYRGDGVSVMIGKTEVRDEINGKRVEDVLYVRAHRAYEGSEAYRVWLETLDKLGVEAESIEQAYVALKGMTDYVGRQDRVSRAWW